ncbi:anti-sigma factor [soil metagenome]
MSDVRPISHEEATDLAGLYVLDALEPAEREAVRRHLTECQSGHPEFAELADVVPALAETIEPLDAPAALRGRVLAAVAAEADESSRPMTAASKPVSGASIGTDSSTPMERSEPVARASFGLPSWLGWAAAAAAVLIVAVVGSWGIGLQARNDQLAQRNSLIASALAARSADGAAIATLSGSGTAVGATGFAAFTTDGEGYIMLVGLPPAPAGQTYQAWYLVDGQPYSAGVLDVGDDGLALLTGIQPREGTDLIALTVERAGGADQPTSDPIIAGALTA